MDNYTNLYFKKKDDLKNYVDKYSRVSYELNFNNGYYNNFVLDALIIVKNLECHKNSKYYISNTILYDKYSNEFISLVKNILLLHATLDLEVHFKYYIFYYVEYLPLIDSFAFIFECKDDDMDGILFNNKYTLL